MLEVRSYGEVSIISHIQRLYVSVDLLKHFNLKAWSIPENDLFLLPLPEGFSNELK